MFVIDFFKDLFRSRVTGVQSSVRGKAFGAQARVKGKVAGSFNRAVDGSVAKAKGAAKGGSPSGPGQAKPKEKKMGFSLFGRRKKQEDAASPQADEADAKTQAINIAEFTDTRFKPCVGWVVVMDGPQEGRDFRLVQGRNRIGTNADMEVVLTDPYVSAHHANLVYTDEGTFLLSDAGSTNGVRLNGKKVMQAQLVDNDTLQMGHTTLRFKALY